MRLGVVAQLERRIELGMSGPNDKADRDNHANQCNREHDAYWQSRGEDERPDDWKERLEDEE